jgi:hypothetical protein
MRRLFIILVLLIVFGMLGMLVWVSNQLGPIKRAKVSKEAGKSELQKQAPVATAEVLLIGYGDLATPPMEDLRKIQHVAMGYFSVVKDAQRFPIGGNEDFSAALRGENMNHQVFIPAGHPVFSPAGLLLDRWGSPLIIHPQAWRELELRSAGPDRVPYNHDDLILTPGGSSAAGRF